ncbi:ATP-grasp domain-containing protein [Obelidium mucronatum]|nr:ATP-grasp domain-containing protein [Obelidium mucronatum]
MSRKHILILHHHGEPSFNAAASFSTFVSPNDNVKIMIICDKVSELDKKNCLDYEVVSSPCTNGKVELAAWRMFQAHGIDVVYTQEEELVLRAAQLRALFGLCEAKLLPDEVMFFRDKVKMKELASNRGFDVPSFKRVWSPANIIDFTNKHGYPVIVKPSLGCGSASINILRSEADRENYIKNDFYQKIDMNGNCIDYNGDMIIEKFVGGSMVHINGHASESQITIAWPFRYVNTCLDFTCGTPYGNLLVPANTAHHEQMIAAAQKLLDILPCPKHLFFHIEMFETMKEDGTYHYTLCEVAARRPGSSIGRLIEECEIGSKFIEDKSHPLFQEMEFRLSCGLGIRHDRSLQSRYARGEFGYSLADLVIPLQVGILLAIPDASTCPVEGVEVVQIASVGRVYNGYNLNIMNTCARLVIRVGENENQTEDGMLEKMKLAKAWYEANVVYQKSAVSVKESGTPKRMT